MRTITKTTASRGRILAAISIAALLGTSTAVQAQGLMSGTGMQPSKQLATPPGTPAIDRPGAEQRALARRRQAHAARSAPHATTSVQQTAAPHR